MTETSEQQYADFWFDPACPWAWMTSRWMHEVEKVRPVTTRWHLMSLSVLNEGRDLPPEYAEMMPKLWGSVRVVAAAQAKHGDEVVGALYTALGNRIHLEQREANTALWEEALAEVGLPTELAAAAEDTSYDDAVRASHQQAIDLVGDDVGTPTVKFGDTAFFGPVVTPAPKGEDAGKLWDGTLLVAATPGFYEIKRSRTQGPIFD